LMASIGTIPVWITSTNFHSKDVNSNLPKVEAHGKGFNDAFPKSLIVNLP